MKAKNPFTIIGDVTYIHLFDKKGKQVAVTMIDSEDHAKVSRFRWCLRPDGYVHTTIRIRPGKELGLCLHALIIDNWKNRNLELDTHHENRIRLDNRKSNLVVCTKSKHHLSYGLRKDNKSGYKGVTWDKKAGKWRARLETGGKNYNIGKYKNIEDAIEARKAAEKELGLCLD